MQAMYLSPVKKQRATQSKPAPRPCPNKERGPFGGRVFVSACATCDDIE